MSVLQVKTIEDFKRFDDIWIPAWQEQGYDLESYVTDGIERYVFYNKKGDFGSAELAPYRPLPDWPVNREFPFHVFKELHHKKVIEVEKLAIKKGKRGSLKSLMEIFSFFLLYGNEHKVDYGISLLNPYLYDALIWRFNIPVKRLMVIDYTDLPYYPTVFPMEAIFQSDFGSRLLEKHKSKTLA